MDFGIANKWALVCAASKGLGRGCAEALVNEGVNAGALGVQFIIHPQAALGLVWLKRHCYAVRSGKAALSFSANRR